MSSLIEIVRFVPDVFEEHSETVIEFLLKKVLTPQVSLEEVSQSLAGQDLKMNDFRINLFRRHDT